jgi:tRNA-specific 2-thiouridylase
MIKFGSLLKKAKELKADFIATGHYAKVTYDAKTKRFALRRGKDKAKDQSYFLFGLTQRQLRSIIFPLSGYLKSEVKEICSDFGLKVANKSPSQEICFVWDNNYPDFLKKIYGIKPVCGQIVNKEGKVLGQHHGVIFFTIGQRRGLGLGGNKIPLYVIGIDAKKNRVIVGTKEDLEKNTLFADGLNWINIRNFQKPIKVKAQIRYNHPAADASVYPLARDCVKVVFDEPQLAIAPGQAVVFYKGDEVLGGGWIR